ncbi:MAG: hypothetical protein HONBIEJF_02216 [Fimbriimonadaceae bacterium]|nr:hypothetical protein [Fimbriimonadaceae bacterium]
MRLCLKLLMLFATLAAAMTTLAQTAPTTMNFQGRLTRLDGKPLPDGQYVVTLRLWKDLTSTNGSDLLITWQNLSVQVRSGVFSTALPNLTEAVLAGGVAYLEIEPSGQAPLSPRVPLLSVPYAVLAGTVFDGAIGTQKLANSAVSSPKLAVDKDSLGRVSGGIAQVGNDSIKIGTDGPSYRLHVSGGASPGIFVGDHGGGAWLGNWSNGGDAVLRQTVPGKGIMLMVGNGINAFSVSPEGNVYVAQQLGVGTGSPTAKVDVVETGDVAIQARNIGGSDIVMVARDSFAQIGPNSSHTLFVGQIGAAALAVTPNQRVGIGLPSPDFALHVRTPGATVSTVLENLAGPMLEAHAATGGGWVGTRNNYPMYLGANYTTPLTILPNGMVGIGTTSPQHTLDVNGFGRFQSVVTGGLGTPTGELRIQAFDNGKVIIGGFSQPGLEVYGPFFTNDTTPSKPMGGSGENWDVSSDRRLKTDIHPLRGALDTLLELSGVTFKKKSDPNGATITGFIAQDVQKVKPNWVSEGDDGYLRVGMGGFNAYVVEAFRDQQRTIVQLRQENTRIHLALTQLQREMQQIKDSIRTKGRNQ